MKTWKKNLVAAAILVTVCTGIYVNWLYTEENVATEDEAAVSEVIKAGEELLKGEFIDKNEKKIIEEIIAEAKALEKRIAEIKAEEESGGNEGGTNDGAQGEDPEPKPEDKPEAGPVTGEGNKMLIFAVIMAVCAAAICVVAIMRKKKMSK